MTKCTKCDGGGLIGSGDQPWLKHGAVQTCDECEGSGKVGEPEAESAPVAPTVEAAPVDNPAPEEKGIFGKVADALGL